LRLVGRRPRKNLEARSELLRSLQAMPSSPAKAGDPVFQSVSGFIDGGDYWILRWSLSSGSPKARPGGGV
jgi:hypothetical protein